MAIFLFSQPVQGDQEWLMTLICQSSLSW